MNRFWQLFARRGIYQDLSEEIREHLEEEIDELVAGGMPPEEARREARRRFGNALQVEERGRAVWGVGWLDTLLQDLRYGLRQLRHNPSFTAAAVLTLAMGIGATSALFTAVRSVLLSPLPFREPARLLALHEHSSDDKFPFNTVAGGVFAEWRTQNHGFADMAIVSSAENDLSGAGGQLPEKVHAAEVSWNLFSTLGVAPALGRGFTAADDQPSANATVVLSWGLWKRRFGGDPAIVKQAVHLDAKPYTVIGIMPQWFAYPDQSAQLWTPIYHEENPREMQAIDSHDFDAVGRLKPGVTDTAALAELSAIVKRVHDEHLDNAFVSKAASSRPLLEEMVGDIKTPLYVLLAATGCLLLIACLNVAGLMVARGTARRRELAIRTALGGGRWRLLGEHLAESLLLSGGGAALGLLLAYGVIRWLVTTRPDMSRVEAIHMDGVVAAFVLGLVFVCGLVPCLASLLSVRGSQILSALQESPRSQSAGRTRVGLRKAILAAEVGLTAVLLIGAGLLVGSYQRLRSVDLGCVTRNVLTMRFSLPEVKYGKAAQRVEFLETLLERVRELPGVRAAGLSRMVPGQGYGGDSGFAIAEHPPLPAGQAQYAMTRWADRGYFTTLGIPLLRGRTFDESRRLDKADEIVINQSFARQYFPGEDPVGKHLVTLGHKSFTIAGVFGDTRYVPAEPPAPIMYSSVYNFGPAYETLVVRSGRDVTSLALPIQRIFQKLDPELAVADILTMDQILGKSMIDASFDATLLAAFAVLSLVLAAVGLFGVTSYVVAQRTGEIGIRMAMGAQSGDVLRLVLGQGMAPALVGLGLGVGGALELTRFLASLLHGVEPGDPLTFAAVCLLLVGVALVASYIPARRAMRVDPMIALRHE